MIDKNKLKRRFSRNAKTYDQYAKVQKIMGDTLIENVKNKDIKNILEIGCGTGYVTRALERYFPKANITAIDLAPGMIEYVKSTMGENIQFICGDAEEMIFNEKYDLIISNATFQWFNHLEQTLGKFINLLNKDGILAFSTFGENTFKELHEAFRKAKDILGLKEDIFPGQSFYSLEKLQKTCNQMIMSKSLENKKILCAQTYEIEHFNSCKEFLFSVKKVGANNSQNHRNKTTPDFIEKVMEIYDQDYLEGEGVRATYHNLFFYIKCEEVNQR